MRPGAPIARSAAPSRSKSPLASPEPELVGAALAGRHPGVLLGDDVPAVATADHHDATRHVRAAPARAQDGGHELEPAVAVEVVGDGRLRFRGGRVRRLRLVVAERGGEPDRSDREQRERAQGRREQPPPPRRLRRRREGKRRHGSRRGRLVGRDVFVLVARRVMATGRDRDRRRAPPVRAQLRDGDLLQRLPRRAGRGRPVGGRLLQQPPHPLADRGRQRVRQRRRLLVDVAVEDAHRAVGLERRAPGQQLVDDHPERVEVCLRPDRLVHRLLRRHVHRRAHRLAGHGQPPGYAPAARGD